MNEMYQTIIETGCSDPQWDAFLASLDQAHHEQSSCWARVKEHQGWTAVRLKVMKDSQWLAGAQMLCKRLPFFGSIGYISSGPFYLKKDDEALDVLIRSINQIANKKRIQYVAITPYAENPYLDQVLMKNGFCPTEERLPPTMTTRATLILDLSKNTDQLLKEMRKKTRQHISIASRSDLRFREGAREDIETLFRLMSMVAAKRGESPVPGSSGIFDRIWSQFHPGGHVRLFLVEADRHPVSAGLIFTFGNTVRFWKIGWSGESDKKHPTPFLYWELIKWSKSNGFRYFDIVQVDAVVAVHLAAGLPATEALKSRQLYGPTVFKLGFGGSIYRFSGPWFRFPNPLISSSYRKFGRFVLTPWLTRKLISKMG